MREFRKAIRKENSHPLAMDEFQPISGFDCGLGLFFNRSARKIPAALPGADPPAFASGGLANPGTEDETARIEPH